MLFTTWNGLPETASTYSVNFQDTPNTRTAPTPFLDESRDPLSVIEEPAASDGQMHLGTPRAPQAAPRNGSLAKAGSTGQLSYIGTKC